MVNELVSVIVRFHRSGNATYMVDALRSLSFQDYPLMQIVIALQDCSKEQEKVIRDWCKKLFYVEDDEKFKKVKIVNFNPPGEGDYRATLLNIGIKNCDGQYVGFLDYDDIVYQNAYSTLVKQACIGGMALTAGGTIKADLVKEEQYPIEYIVNKEPFLKEKRSWFDLAFDNFLPIHSYIINREKMGDLIIYEDYQALEDYDLILRCLVRGGVDLEVLDVPVAEYRFRCHMPNTTQLMDECEKTHRKWAAGREKIDELKRNSKVSIPLDQLQKFLTERVYVN